MDMDDSDLMAHFEVNTLGLLRLSRATAPLLLSRKQTKFVYISSELASIAGVAQLSSLTAAYGVSKAAGNYLVKKIDAEHADLVAFPIDPGYFNRVNEGVVLANICQLCPNRHGESRRAVQWTGTRADDYYQKCSRYRQASMSMQ